MTEPRVRFPGGGAFQRDLKSRVAAHLAAAGVSGRDPFAMYLKTVLLFAWLASSYVLLIFVAERWWEVVPLAVLVGLATAGIGFGVQHDGGHNGYSSRPWVNAVMAATLDLVGGSSYIWRYKHGVVHHTYTNIPHVDQDTDVGPWARLTPLHRKRRFHRFQHLYLWALYGLLPVKWHFIDDYRNLAGGHIGTQPYPRPKGRALVGLFVGKAAFYSWTVVIPLYFHWVWTSVLVYALASATLGVALAVTFQLAHCLEEAEYPAAQGLMEAGWAEHQVATTVDFARDSELLCWYLGGLNFQVEHHLFPQICHIHYPALARIVEATCVDHGIRYRAHATAGSALRSHYRWLRRMGSGPQPGETEQPVVALVEALLPAPAPVAAGATAVS